jgi:hypothetical protein
LEEHLAMSITTSFHDPLLGHGRLLRESARRTARRAGLVFVLALGLLGIGELYLVSQQPGRVIRRELLAAAGEFGSPLVPNPTDSMRQAMRRHFGETDVDVDASRIWPNVAVTIRGLDREACEAAALKVRRIEGPIVVNLDSPRAPADCRESNDMTWWIMP